MTQPKIPPPRNSVFQNKISSEVDWLGNTCLHNAFGRYDIQEDLVQQILQTYPQFVSYCNWCGRLPLHYAVDRGRINLNALELLLDAYPQGMHTKDTEGVTPFDIVRKWEHQASVQSMFLSRMSVVEKNNYLQIQTTPITMISRFMDSLINSGRLQRSESFGGDTINSDDDYFDDDQLLLPPARTISGWVDTDEEEEEDGGVNEDQDNSYENDMKRQKLTYTENIRPFSFHSSSE